MTKQINTCPELEALEREIELAKAVVTRSKAQRTESTITEIEQSDWLEAAVQRLEAIKAEAQAQPKRITVKATAKSRNSERKTIRAKAKHIEATAQPKPAEPERITGNQNFAAQIKGFFRKVQKIAASVTF